ncbi:SDR family oxidoreductase [Parvularcula dongshanensis]|uniref:NAD(P)-dependent dehydrogenase (Short-subunit alcohol dehydrogenase family) n=1 Tax=Parvularcula dongshanensis TaxID=1173995 RepID=A0A840I7G0_9PROT|nr:SDR family oxidoreductase [Parvularcula dongshanensis]MBB4660114.1 NAD(P)-dependent dehydrogenase (short-subunit alcohol dehydrogenase family) [Parvularcula dongshanensis]
MARFEGKRFLVTGGSGGIGRATAELLASEGAEVVVTGTNEDKLQSVRDAIPGVKALKNDSSDPDAAKTLAEEAGQLDGIFLNAGYAVMVPHDEVSTDKFEEQFHVNVRGPMLQMSALSGQLKDGGTIVVNTSIAQYAGMEGNSLYGATKGALHSYVRTLTKEMAKRKVRVNAVAPGPISTDFGSRAGMSKDEEKKFQEEITKQVPLGRFGEAKEIATAVAFLLSDDASYVNGAELIVDGGMSGR